MGVDCLSMLHDYVGTNGHGSVFNKRIRDRICDLSKGLAKAEDAEAFKDTMTQFYKEFGVGKLGLHKAFRIAHTEEGALIEPITKIAHVHLDDLVGYEIAKKKLIDNTKAFVEGKKANNCLLFGDAGTGKSSSIKAILYCSGRQSNRNPSATPSSSYPPEKPATSLTSMNLTDRSSRWQRDSTTSVPVLKPPFRKK